MNNYLISLNNPCHEDWETMTPTERGKFCSNCSKEVIDFSNATDNEIIKFIEASKGKLFCGQFEATQLNRWLEQTELKRTNPALYRWLLGLLLLTSTQTVIAQDNRNHVQIEAKEKNPKSCGVGIVKGFVFDTLGKPVYHASIRLVGSDTSKLTDENGGFSIQANIGDTLSAYKDKVLINSTVVASLAQTYIITNPTPVQSPKQEAEPRAFLRGIVSIQTDSSPLWIVDGLPVSEKMLDFIDIKKIKAINIIKGEQANAMYGSSAKNGVIFVQTKLSKKERKRLMDKVNKSPVQ
jgi:TonB-dependent SusC/RagA subfamily outer membrane receptor